MTAAITRVVAWEALDSRGRPTVAARVECSDGTAAHALVPSGASAGSHEALELRDGGHRYGGRGVRNAVMHVNDTLARRVIGRDPADVDDALLGVDSNDIGANATLAVSLAALRAGGAARGGGARDGVGSK
jgi:enolase